MSDPQYAVATISQDAPPLVTIAGLRELNELCTDSAQKTLVIAPTQTDLTRLPAEVFQTRSAITLFPVREGSELAADWTDLPPPLAVRLAPPEVAALVVLSPQTLSENGDRVDSFLDVSSPVWDWLIRQTDRGCAVRLNDALAHSTGTAAATERPRLIPDPPDRSRSWLLAHLQSEHLIPSPASAGDAIAVRAGLLQMHDFIDASHRQSQSIEGAGRHAAGDYWHAVMHRREPDYGNSKYWFRRVGAHPLFGALAERAEHVLRDCPSQESDHWREKLVTAAGWDAAAFVDLCAACAGAEQSPLGIAAREIQWQEMRMLLRHTYRDASGP